MKSKKKYFGFVLSLGFLANPVFQSTAFARTSMEQAWPLRVRMQMSRLTDIGFKLGVIAAPLCPSKRAGMGIMLDYIQAYDPKDRPAIAALLKLGDAPQIAAVAPGSPADMAGIMPGDELLAIGRLSIATLQHEPTDKTLLADQLEDRLAASPIGTGISLELRRGHRTFLASLTPLPVCAARFILKTDEEIAAYTDGSNIAISTKLITFTLNDDEVALVAGHELAHIVYRDSEARNLRHRRWLEDRADALGARLMQCAGYQAELGSRYWDRREQTDALRAFRSPTHRSRKARAALIRSEAALSSCPPDIHYPVLEQSHGSARRAAARPVGSD